MNKTLHLGALKLKVAIALEQAYAYTDCPLPGLDEVICEALTLLSDDAHTTARSLGKCHKADTCTAQAVVLRHVADWLTELAREVHEEGS